MGHGIGPEPRPSSIASDDLELVARLRAGDHAAFEAFVRIHTPRLLAAAQRVSLREADAEDAVQDAFLSALRSIHTFDGRSSLGTWLYRIAINKAISRGKRSSARRESSIEDLLPAFSEGRHVARPEPWSVAMSPPVGGEGPSVEVLDALRTALASLPEEHRAAVVLKDVEGMQSSEIAVALGISDALVRQRVHRGRQAIMRLIQPIMQEPVP